MACEAYFIQGCIKRGMGKELEGPERNGPKILAAGCETSPMRLGYAWIFPGCHLQSRLKNGPGSSKHFSDVELQ